VPYSLVFSITVIITRDSGIITVSILSIAVNTTAIENTNGNNTGVADYDNGDGEY
jgi:hypothetical protein